MGVYDKFDFTQDMQDFMFPDSSDVTFDSLPSFPGSDKMVTGQMYQWLWPTMSVVKTGVSPDGANVLRFVHVTT